MIVKSNDPRNVTITICKGSTNAILVHVSGTISRYCVLKCIDLYLWVEKYPRIWARKESENGVRDDIVIFSKRKILKILQFVFTLVGFVFTLMHTLLRVCVLHRQQIVLIKYNKKENGQKAMRRRNLISI